VRTGNNSSRHALALAVAAVFAMGVSFATTVVLARLLTGSAYGSVIQLLGVLLVFTMPGTALTVAIVRHLAHGGFGTRDATGGSDLRRIHRDGYAVAGALALLALAGRDLVGRWLSIPDPGPVFPILCAAAVYLLVSIDRGVIQASRSYGSLAVNLMIEGGTRSVGMIAAAVGGFGATGVAYALLLSEVVAAVHARWAAASLERAAALPAGALPARRYAHVVYDSALALGTVAMLAGLQNVDIVILGRENHANSGPYAPISVATKALVFWALFSTNYLVPEAAMRRQAGAHAYRQLAQAFAAVLAPAVLLLAIATIAPSTLLAVAFGEHSREATAALLPLTAAMACLSVTVVLTVFMLGSGWTQFLPILVAGLVAAMVVTTQAAGNIGMTARGDLLVQAAIAIAMVAVIAVNARRTGSRRTA